MVDETGSETNSDDENPLMDMEFNAWPFGSPEFTKQDRLKLTTQMNDGTATPEMIQFAAALLHDPMPSPMPFHVVSFWDQEIDRIRVLFERGCTAQAYKELARHLEEGQVDQIFLSFVAEVLNDASTIRKLPKRRRFSQAALTYKIGQAFEKAKELGLRGEHRIRCLENKFRMHFKTLELRWAQYRKEQKEAEELAHNANLEAMQHHYVDLKMSPIFRSNDGVSND